VPILILCLVLVPIGVPSLVREKSAQKIDIRGCILVAVASSTTILVLSFAGTIYPWASKQVIGLLIVSLIFWIFFFRAETRADEPIIDPQALKNRTFFTVAIAGLLSFFGLVGMMLYFPLFLQGVQGVSATLSGQVITPLSVLMAFSLKQSSDEATMTSIGNPRVLLSETAMKDLEESFHKWDEGGPMLFDQTVQAIRTSLEASLRSIFIIGAITMLLSFLLILTVPEIPLDTLVEDDNLLQNHPS
jgi:hypothetical protein